jgi:hypothetical protein
MAQTDPWTIFTAVATAGGALAAIFAALATAASGVVIAFQAYYTRRSVIDTDAALRLGQAEFERGQKVFHEAQKARIDAEMPRIALSITPGYSIDIEGYPEASLTPGTTFPATSQQSIAVGFNVDIINESNRQIRLEVLTMEGLTLTLSQLVLPKGADKVITARISRTVAEWVAESEAWSVARRKGKWPVDNLILRTRFTLPADFGADETHEIVFAGSVLQKSADDTWEIAPTRQNYALTLVEEKPFTRDYWRSRRDNERIT